MSARRDTSVALVGFVALAVVVGTMAVDHLLGTERSDDDGLVDPTMFVISVVLSLAVAAVLFGWLVPRERRKGPERSARSGLVCSIASIVPGIAFVWVGFPFVVAGAGLALGLEGRRGARRAEAGAAVAIGGLALGLGTLAYAVAAVS
jgi:hypothetical protein